MENTTQTLTKYCTLSDICHCNYLFADFESYSPSSVRDGCRCDICYNRVLAVLAKNA